MKKVIDTRDTKLMAKRVTPRYARKGTVHANQGYFAVNRDGESGKFVKRV